MYAPTLDYHLFKLLLPNITSFISVLTHSEPEAHRGKTTRMFCRSSWQREHLDTKLLPKYVCKKVRVQFNHWFKGTVNHESKSVSIKVVTFVIYLLVFPTSEIWVMSNLLGKLVCCCYSLSCQLYVGHCYFVFGLCDVFLSAFSGHFAVGGPKKFLRNPNLVSVNH